MLDKLLNAPVITELRQCHLFKAMDETQFDQMLKHCHLKNLKAEQVLFQHGMPLTHIYFVYDGSVKLCRTTRKGDEKIIEVVQTGKSFAEGVLFKGMPEYPVSSIALKQSIVVAIKANVFLSLLKSSNSLCINMLGHLSTRLHWMLIELDKQTLHNASFRIIDYFLSQVSDSEDSSYDLCLTVPKRDIASRLSIKPETLSRTLKSLVNKDLISIEDNHIILKDVHQLREMVQLEEI